MEALIGDEDVMDKGVSNTVKDHKRKHNDDDDDEDPSAGPNQGKQTKRRRTKEIESFKKPSTTKKTPKGKALTKGSKTGKSASAKEPVEDPIAEVVMDDVGEDVAHDEYLPQYTSKLKTDKTSKCLLGHLLLTRNGTRVRLYLINPNSLGLIKWSPLQRQAFNLLKATCSSSIELEYNFKECFNALIVEYLITYLMREKEDVRYQSSESLETCT
uniref:Uncharacterized protein n=1 Tax=Tanacetum cinerariifolium TaxID=118510 RepID=A0A6L2NNT7_TANCI|nr:hypothetical protein [Tanacetum cinerariifolium]